MTDLSPTVDELYLLVSEEIFRAERLSDIGALGAAQAYSDVSLLEEQIARRLPADSLEGQVARRGAVRAAVEAGELVRAERLRDEYLADSALDAQVAQELIDLVPASQAETATSLEGVPALRDERVTSIVPPLARPSITVSSSVLWPRHGTARLVAAIREYAEAIPEMAARWDVYDVSGQRWADSPQDLKWASVASDALVLIVGAGAAGSKVVAALRERLREVPTLLVVEGKVGEHFISEEVQRSIDILHVPDLSVDVDDFPELTDWLVRNSAAINFGPLKRRELEAQFSPLQRVLRQRMDGELLAELDPERRLAELAERTGLTTQAILFAVNEPVGTALLPIQSLLSLAAELHVSPVWGDAVTSGLEVSALRKAVARYDWSEAETYQLTALVRNKWVVDALRLWTEDVDTMHRAYTSPDDWSELYQMWTSVSLDERRAFAEFLAGVGRPRLHRRSELFGRVARLRLLLERWDRWPRPKS